MNTLPLNMNKVLYPTHFYIVDDDLYKRILTWHLFKGDGKYFDVRWWKRRIMRFITGVNGGPGPDGVLGPVDTSAISISISPVDQVQISIGWIRRRLVGAALLNAPRFKLNAVQLNQIILGPFTQAQSLPYAPIFKAAMDAGVLEIPFQYTTTVVLQTRHPQ
jgi:hypothetical protein